MSIITEAKNNGLQTNADREEIALDKVENLLKDTNSQKINKNEFTEKYNDIAVDIEKILKKQGLTSDELNMTNILSWIQKKKKTDEETDTKNMSELESEEFAEQRRNQQGKRLKILTPNQMLSRLPVNLAQSKAGNNSEKLKNEIRQLLYSLDRSKNMTNKVYNNLIKYI